MNNLKIQQQLTSNYKKIDFYKKIRIYFVFKVFLKFYIFFKINILLMFSDHFNMLISKIIFKK